MKRFDMYDNRKGRAWMEEDEEGPYVLHADAEQLQAQLLDEQAEHALTNIKLDTVVEQKEKANTEIAKRGVRILYLEDVVSSQNSVNLRQASSLLAHQAEIKELKAQLAEERARLDWLVENFEGGTIELWCLATSHDYPAGLPIREAIDQERKA